MIPTVVLLMVMSAANCLGSEAVRRDCIALASPSPAFDPDLLDVAARIASASDRLSRIWPGYWPEGQPFVIHVAAQGALLVADERVPPGWEPLTGDNLPPSLRGRSYWRRGSIEGASRPFITGFPIGDGRIAIFVNAAQDPETTFALLLHEQFHHYQASKFRPLALQFVAPDAVPDRVSFAAAAELERRILSAALSASSATERDHLLRVYLAARHAREATVPAEVRRIERQFEISEGTARYVDRAARSIAFEGVDLERLLVEDLGEPLLDKRGPFTTIWFRTRSYATGAALTHLFKALDPHNWRAAIEAGGDPAALIEAKIGLPPDPAAVVAAAHERFDIAGLVRQAKDPIEAGARAEIKNEAEFMALGRYPLTVEFAPPATNEQALMPTFAASEMASLSPSTLVLRRAETFTIGGGAGQLVVRQRPVMMTDRSGHTRIVVLLDAPPAIEGQARLPHGTRRLQDLRIRDQGVELRFEGPVEVNVGASGMSVRKLPVG